MQPQMRTSKLTKEGTGMSTTRSAKGFEMERPPELTLDWRGACINAKELHAGRCVNGPSRPKRTS